MGAGVAASGAHAAGLTTMAGPAARVVSQCASLATRSAFPVAHADRYGRGRNIALALQQRNEHNRCRDDRERGNQKHDVFPCRNHGRTGYLAACATVSHKTGGQTVGSDTGCQPCAIMPLDATPRWIAFVRIPPVFATNSGTQANATLSRRPRRPAPSRRVPRPAPRADGRRHPG